MFGNIIRAIEREQKRLREAITSSEQERREDAVAFWFLMGFIFVMIIAIGAIVAPR